MESTLLSQLRGEGAIYLIPRLVQVRPEWRRAAYLFSLLVEAPGRVRQHRVDLAGIGDQIIARHGRAAIAA
jgi:hypothetical protein